MKMKTTTAVIFCTMVLVPITQSSKILSIALHPSKSIFNCNHAVLKALVKAGHEIVIVTEFAKEAAQENFTSIIDASDGPSRLVGQSSVEDFSKKTFNGLQDYFADMELPLCDKIANLKEIQGFMETKEKVFDAMTISTVNHHACFYKIAQKLNIPVIAIVAQRSWFATEFEIANPRHPLLMPVEFGRGVNHNNFMARVFGVLEYINTLHYWYKLTTDAYNKFRTDVKPAMVFVNSHSSYFPRPLNPNMIEIGGIHMDDIQPLPTEIQTFLDDAKHGAILFTFGSVVKATKLPKTKIQAFIGAFAEIPQRVIWKYEEEMEELPPNVMLMKWVPQKDILAHKNIKAFISHCGQGAIHETLYNAVPLISCPLFLDQPINAKNFENLEAAVHLDYETITKESILKAIYKVVNNKKYYDKMQKLSQAFRDRPLSPQQTVVYWTEYVIRHKGAPHLMSPAVQLNWFQYLLLDVICFIIFIIFVILFSIYFICKSICSFSITPFRFNALKNKSH